MTHGFFQQSPHGFFIQSPHRMRGGGSLEIIVGGQAATGADDTAGYSKSGEFILSRDHGGFTLEDVCIDAAHFYTTGVRASSITTRKYTLAGTPVWTFDHGDNAKGVAVDQAGNVYITGLRVSGVTTRKLDSSGAVVWNYNFAAGSGAVDTQDIRLDQSGNSYVCGGASLGGGIIRMVEKIDSSGTIAWFVNNLGATSGRCLSVDLSENVFVGTAPEAGTNYSLHKLSGIDGSVIWQRANSTEQCNDVAVGPEGNVYACFSSLRAYDTNGTLLWSVLPGEIPQGVAVDSDGYVYTTLNHGLNLGKITKRDPSDGSEIWTTAENPNTARSLAIDVLPGRQGAFG